MAPRHWGRQHPSNFPKHPLALDLGLGGMVNATYLMTLVPDDGAHFTSADVGWSLFMEETIDEAKAHPIRAINASCCSVNPTAPSRAWNGTVQWLQMRPTRLKTA